MLFGMSPAVAWVLPMLGKHPDEYPRFRDCFLGDPDHPEYDNHIHIYTRVGGGNRGDYEEEIKKLRSIPGYVDDFDDEFDSTFATFVFEVPGEWRADCLLIVSGKGKQMSQGYKNQLYRVYPELKDKFMSILKGEAND